MSGRLFRGRGGVPFAAQPRGIVNLIPYLNTIASLTAQNTALQGEVDSLEAEVDSLEGQVASLQAANAVLQGQVNALTAQVALLQAQIVTLEDANAALQAVIDGFGSSSGWVHITPYFAGKTAPDFAGTGAPSNATITVDGGGITTSCQNDVNVDGTREGPSVSVPATTIFPQYVAGTNQLLVVLGLRIVNFGSDAWQALVLDDTPDANCIAAGGGFVNFASAQSIWLYSATGRTILAGDAPIRMVIGRYHQSTTRISFLMSSNQAGTSGAQSLAGDESTHKISVAWGRASSANNGVAGGKADWWGFMLELPPNAPVS